VAAETTEDVVSAVNFARENNLRLVGKGGGHSYLGTSNAPDLLLIWTRRMNSITLHDAFVAKGCDAVEPPQPTVTVGAGAIWMHVYNLVTTRGGRYVQGGGCLTIGVAGFVQAGGFGSFSKNYGTAAANLLEAEVVTADGTARIAKTCTNADLFWALKGGGGSSFGVVTRLTCRTRELPEYFGGLFTTIRASSDAAFGRLIGQFIAFYATSLLNPHWGDIVTLQRDNTLVVRMTFQGLDRQQAHAVWQPFLGGVVASGSDLNFTLGPRIVEIPAQRLWDPAYLRARNAVLIDDRSDAPAENLFWAGSLGEAGQFLFGFESLWLPRSLLQADGRERLADALFAATRHWSVGLHFQKGLSGASEETISAAQDTATNPAVLDAFVLAIIAGGGPPSLSRPSRPPARSRGRAAAGAGDRQGCRRTEKSGAGRGHLRRGKQLLRARMAARLLRPQLSEVARDKEEIRSHGSFLRPPRRRQRRMERRWFHAANGGPEGNQRGAQPKPILQSYTYDEAASKTVVGDRELRAEVELTPRRMTHPGDRRVSGLSGNRWS
jgi:hypothetical protein